MDSASDKEKCAYHQGKKKSFQNDMGALFKTWLIIHLILIIYSIYKKRKKSEPNKINVIFVPLQKRRSGVVFALAMSGGGLINAG